MFNKIIISIFIFSISSFSQNIRPVRDNIGFIWTKNEMQQLTQFIEKQNIVPNSNENIIAAISPHDDYLYAGNVEYSVLKNVKAKEVVIFGVTHSSPRKRLGNPKNIVIFDSFDQWKGLNKNVKISPLRELLKKSLNQDEYIVNNEAHKLEHSIESLIPWLQLTNPNIKITPIMITEMNFNNMDSLTSHIAQIIENYIKTNKLKLGKDIAFVFSCDTTHYGTDFNYSPYGLDEASHTKGIENDKNVSKVFLEKEISSNKIASFLKEKNNRVKGWCGKYSVPFGLLTTNKVVMAIKGKPLSGKFVKYSDSYSHGVLPIHIRGAGITAPFSLVHWVGYLGVTYTLAD